jgi:CSLREA domain-containing protein
MQPSVRSLRSSLVPLLCRTTASGHAIFALFFALLFLGTLASAQNVTISGTVFAPNGVDPLNNVLVYAISSSAVTPGTGILAPLTSGATCSASDPNAAGCMTTIYAVPSGVAIYSYTAVDGTFTLSDVPQDTYTVVIQAGKWRRQFYNVTVASGGLTGQSYNMPSTHGALSSPDGYGEIPRIAIVTGGVDAVECVLRDAGVADSEFTEPSNSGSINFYTGTSGPGAKISSTTVAESALVSSAATLNGYDIVMFPCQGTGSDSSVNKTNSANLKSYANAGGRVFATHYSYLWLDNANTFQPSATSGVADWNLNQANPANGPATVNADFDNGKALGQWLQDLGSSTTLDQVEISTLRQDLTGVIAPTQSWLTLNADGAIMQMTFNTPLGADIEGQFGRVLYNEYHVEDESADETTGKIFPAECGTASPYSPKTPSQMTAQEKMLEYSLFDLSSFVTGIVVPTVSISITPDPSSFNEGDTADTITVDVTNTSSTVPLPSNTILMLTLPAGITATAMTDSTGGWICTVATLTCTRTAGIAVSTSDSVVLTVGVSPTATAGVTSTTGTISALVASPNFSSNVNDPLAITINQHAAVTWAAPAPITYPTPLSSAQLNAVGNTPSSVPGNFVYTDSGTLVSIGSVLAVGSHPLTVTFTPGGAYSGSYPGTGTASVVLVVNPPPDATSTTTTAAFGAPVIAGSPVLGESVTVTATVGDTTNPATSPAGTVTFVDTVGSTQTTLGTVAVSGGSASITYAPTVGSHTVTSSFASANAAQFTASADPTGTSFTLAPYSGAVSSFAVSAATSPVYTGSPDTVTVTAVDAYGNAITNYSGPVTLSSTDSGAVFSTPVFTNGVGTATVSFATPGSQTVTVTAGSVTAISSPITVGAPPSFVVTSFTDDSVGVAANCPAGGPSNGNGGDCSLRDALAAVAAAGAGTITLPTNLPTNLTVDSTLTIPPDASIVGPTTGSGASQTNLLTISGGGASSNFPVFTVGSGVTSAAISNVTIAKGNSSSGGGAIENNGTLTLTDDTLSGNSAAGNGGAISNTGTLTVVGSTLSGNTSGGNGGALDNTGTLTLLNSTVSGDFASIQGGGIYSSGTMTLSGNTISANTAGQGGGGVYNAASTPTNTTLANTIASGNTQGTTLGGGVADDLDGSSNTNNGGNVVGVSNGSTVNATPIQLSALGSYGGLTDTMIPLPGSPAINAGLVSSIAAGATTDQRGLPNTKTSYPGCSSSPCVDAGAVETNYSLNFVSEPSTSVTQDSNFSAAVTLDESGNLFTAAAVPISLSLSGNGTLTNGTAATSSGVANFSSLQVNAIGNGDTLTANLTLNPASSPVAAISTTSTSFQVGQDSTTISASNATPTYSAGNQGVSLSANVASSGGTVNAGTVAFTILQSGTVIGTAVTSGTVSNGSASATYTLPAGMAAGPYTIQAVYNGSGPFASSSDSSHSLTVQQAPATVTLNSSSLSQTYAGSPLAVTSTTNPTGLTVAYTYNGSSTVPTAAGTYAVVATINDPNYTGTATGTLVISKAAAIVTLTPSSLSQTYTGSPISVASTTNPTGLNVTYTYNGSSTAPSAAGTYAVVATINDPNYTGTATGTLVISKAAAIVTLTPSSLSQTYTGSPVSVASTTNPTGLAVTYTYNGSSTAPTAAGSYPVVATINDLNYSGATTGTLVIAKAIAPVILMSSTLSQTYTGSPLSVTSTTAPAGLNVTYTYNGSSTAPTPAGSYPVVATIIDPNYTGSTTGTLVIAKAVATVTLTPSTLNQTYTGLPLPVTSTTNPTGLNVTYAYSGSSTAPTAAGSYPVVATINDPNYTGSTTGTLVIAKPALGMPVVFVTSNANPVMAQTAITFTATISSTSGQPTGTVNFMDGTTMLGQGALSGGAATLTTSSLIAGSHSITAVYSGDSVFSAATSGPMTQTVLDFALNSVAPSGGGSGSSQTVNAGAAANYTLAIVPTTGSEFPTPTTLTVSGIPAGATVSIATAPWTQLTSSSWSFPASTAFANFGFTIQAPAATVSQANTDPLGRRFPPLLWGVLLLPFAGRMRRAGKRLRRTTSVLLLLVVGFATTAGLIGCGSGSGTGTGFFVQQPQTYTIVVTATSGALSHSTTLTLTVQ